MSRHVFFYDNLILSGGAVGKLRSRDADSLAKALGDNGFVIHID